MKKLRLFFAAATLCAAAAVGYNAYETATMTEEELLIQANLEALSDGEDYYLYFCRCHSDGNCYSGSMVSFRPNCAKTLSSSGVDCSYASGNCS